MRGGGQRARVLRVGARRELALLVGFGFLVMVVIGLGAAFASRSVAQDQALEDSERMTQRLAKLVIGPAVGRYLAKQPGAAEELTRTVQNRMADGNLTEVTVWSADGLVLFSNKAEDIGHKVSPPPDGVPQAIAGETTSDFEDGEPEADNPAMPADDAAAEPERFVEVYTPLQVTGQPPLVFEAYYNYERVDQVAHRLLQQTLPLVLIPLVILQLIQIPIALSLARRIKRHEHERSRLLERALSVSDRERVRFAADLHDGPIQDLAGISYALGAVAPTVIDRHASLMARVQDALKRSIESLRGLMTDLYPPDLRSGNLDQTITTLADQVRESGAQVELDLGEVPGLSEEGVATLYRVARESLANVQKHAQASMVKVTLGLVEGFRGTDQPCARLVVADNGVGVDVSRLDRRAEGHLGLRLLADRVESIGGELRITSAPGQGTTVQAVLPLGATSGD
ncbi:MAG: sensor histidine kinase [Nocardioidaceae bacterium]